MVSLASRSLAIASVFLSFVMASGVVAQADELVTSVTAENSADHDGAMIGCKANNLDLVMTKDFRLTSVYCYRMTDVDRKKVRKSPARN